MKKTITNQYLLKVFLRVITNIMKEEETEIKFISKTISLYEHDYTIFTRYDK